MVDRSWSSKSENKRFSTKTKSRKSSSVSSEFDPEYREHLEGKYLGNGLEIRPPSGTNHQQPGSHLSIDTRLSELSLADDGRLHSSHPSSGKNKKSSQYKVLVDKPNCYITSPFKQGYQIPNKRPTKVVDPSIQLKKVTKESIDKVRQQFRRPKPPPHSSIYAPRLRKAKLKTTGRPISGSGPSIKQCRGIQGGGQVKGRPTPPFCYYNDDRSYATHSPSLRPGSPTELHRPESSVHCTSRVPSVIDDSLSDQIVDSTYSNEYVTESWSRHTINGEQTHDLFDPRDQEGSIGGCGNEKPEADLDEDHVIKDQKTTVHLSNDTEDKVTSEISSSTKDKYGTCKPFRETKDNNDSDSDDDGGKNKRTLLSSHNYQNSNKLRTQGWDSNTSSPGNNETSNGNEVKSQTNSKEMREGTLNENFGDKMTSSLSQCTNSSEEVFKKNNLAQESLNNGIVHIVDSTSSNVSPLMTIHVRGRLENSGDYKPGTESFKSEDINNVDYPTQDDIIEDYDDDDEDTDRIPSALIWKNLDQLNLSMNASSDSSKDELTFSSRARKVQSAGPQRKTTSDLPSNMDSKPPRSKQPQRVSSGKSRKTKRKHHEQVDKAELLKKYLTEESKKFSAHLPGYFTEQFHIIQEAKKDKTSGPLEEHSKTLMKYNDKEEEEGKEKDCRKVEDINEDKESTSLFSVEMEASSSSGVFFTMESTSTYDMDSLSGHTEDTVELGSDTKELSDDTGFETMPGLSRSQTTDKSLDDDLKHEIQEEEVKFVKLEDLEVVAKAKHLTDPRTINSHFKCCPHEPLNFTINAKPPTGYLFYFAYGVDMNAKRMSLYLRREYKRLWGVLFGFKLRFNKKGSSNDAGGFANVEFSPGSSVEGCVYTITDADLSMLDNCMGYPKHYCRVVLPVWMSNCHDPDQHGVAQYCIPAVLYVAEQQWVEHENIKTLDCTYSVNQCLKASDILTPNYVDYLSQQATA